MKVFTAALLAATVLVMCSVAAAQTAYTEVDREKPLSAYQGKNRMLLVFSPELKNAAYLEQMKLLKDEKAGLAERQLLVIPVLVLEGGRPPTGDPFGALAKRFKVDEQSFQVVLVGKDGHDAYRSAKPVTAATLYEKIDAMPMRREEMRQKEKKD